jgi:hypothetical protein
VVLYQCFRSGDGVNIINVHFRSVVISSPTSQSSTTFLPMLPPLLHLARLFLTSCIDQNTRFHDTLHSGNRGTLHIRIHDASKLWLIYLLILPGGDRSTEVTRSATARLEESSRVQYGEPAEGIHAVAVFRMAHQVVELAGQHWMRYV